MTKATAFVSFQGGTPSRLCSVHGPVWPRTLTLFKVNLSGLHGYAGGLNCCLGHFTDSVTFVAASNEKRCFVTGACAEGAVIGKGVKHTYVSIFVRNYVDTDGIWADSD